MQTLVDKHTKLPIREGDVREDHRGNKFRVSIIRSDKRKVFLVPVDEDGEALDNARPLETEPDLVGAKFN